MKRPALADVHATGPFLVKATSLPPEYRNGDPFVDLAPFRGQCIPVGLTLAMRILGVAKQNGAQLLLLNALRRFEHPDRHLQFVMIDPSHNAARHYDSLSDMWKSLLDLEDLADHKKIRQLLFVPPTHPSPEIVHDSLYFHLSKIGNFGMAEVGGLLPISHASKSPVLAKLRRRRGTCRWPVSHPAEPNRDPIEFARELAPDALKFLPQSCLASRRGSRYAPPTVSMLEKIRGLGSFGTAALIYSLRWCPKAPNPAIRYHDLLVFERMQFVLGRDADPKSPDIVALRRYLDEGDVIWHDTRATRLRTVVQWLLICRRLRRIAGDFLAAGEFSPTAPPFTTEERTELYTARHLVAQLGDAVRKEDAFKVLESLDDLVDVCNNRRAQIRLCGNAVRATIAAMKPQDEFDDVVVPLSELDALGKRTGQTMELTLRVWRTPNAWASLTWTKEILEQDYDVDHQLRLKSARRRFNNGQVAKQPFVVEVLEATGIEPSFVTICKNFAYAAPGKLPRKIRIQRFELLTKLGLPGALSIPTGLLGFESNRLSLARNAAICGRTFIPLEEFEHAIRFAALIFEIALHSMRRLGEIVQLQIAKLKDVELNGKPCHGHKVTPKVSRFKDHSAEKCDLILSAAQAEEALALQELYKARFGLEKFPVVKPNYGAEWKVPPAKYVLSFDGRALSSSLVCTFLRYLFAGWPKVTAHLLRHTAAGDAADNDEPLSFIQEALDHDSIYSSVRYSALPPEWEERKEEQSETRRMERIDAL